MKVCIPSNGEGGLEDQVCEHFGRASTFTVYETQDGAVHVVPNTSEHMGGSGKPPEIIIRTGSKVLLCSGLGPKAIDLLSAGGVEVYVGASGTVQSAIDGWRAGRLAKASLDTACKEHRH
ncbi:MAG: NifB/NifX family molybdenum-iron cluster-binding protein [Thermoplasmata archaeon]|jgi:predicted Fe-Mo cluster-binding NifX family protein|nr:NifB/NifX family molybdenum-iron cluster-binding protein [Thermoplasmata archaeon]